jgi:small-conductance mechanosensitive channel
MNLNDFWSRIEAHLPQVLAALPVAVAIAVGAMLLNLILGRSLLLVARRMHLSDSDVLPFRHILRWVLRILALILILGVFGFQLGGIWAIISTILGLIAIGFVAVWSLLSNTSSTLLILFLRPFQIGDDLEFAGEPVRGRVIDLNFFFTTLLDHEGAVLQIPNNLFFQKTLKRRRNDPPVSLAFQLNNPAPARVPPPPPPPAAAGASAKTPPPDPLLQLPDMRSISPSKPR